MKILKNKPALLVTVLGLSLGISLGQNYLQRQHIKALESSLFTPFEWELSKEMHIEIPDFDIGVHELEMADLEAIEHDLESETERLKQKMAKLQAEYELLLQNHDRFVEEHFGLQVH
ncbi:MAG: hypothetical protein AAF242_16645 [Bacteroidota bacterium]